MIAIAKTSTKPLDLAARERPDAGPLAMMVSEIERLEQLFAGWSDGQRGALAAYKRAIDALHGEAIRRLVRACKADAAAALRAAVADDVVYSVLRQLDIVKPSLDERVERALGAIRPQLASHGGDVELVRLAPPAVELRMVGACDGCASSLVTFHAGIVSAVRDACPEIIEVRLVR